MMQRQRAALRWGAAALLCLQLLAGVRAEPHFYSFAGEWFAFPGEGGNCYALLSELKHEVNACFSDFGNATHPKTYMTKVGVKFENHTLVQVELNGMGSLAVEGNDVDLTHTLQHKEPYRITPRGYAGTVTAMWQYPSKFGNGDDCQVETPDFIFNIYTGKDNPWLDVATTIKNGNIKDMHGVIGQSWGNFGPQRLPVCGHKKPCVQGKALDYRVDGIFSHEFRYTMFDKPITVNLRAVNDESKAAYELIEPTKARKMLR